MRYVYRTSRVVQGTLLSLVLTAVGFFAGCGGEPLDVTSELLVTEVTTGWFDSGIQPDGRNKLVPEVAFQLKNGAQNGISIVTVMGVFRVLEDVQELGSSTVMAISADGLPVGDSTQLIVMRARLGYASTEPRLQMLQHRLFVDAKVELFAKHRSSQWLPIGEYVIDRQLLTD